MPAIRESFGSTQDAQPVERYILSNQHGMEVSIISYGGIVQSLKVPDKRGELADIVLGFNTLQPYLGEHPYFGALIGRYGNRIAKGRFQLDGVQYELACNNGSNHLHGGINGFDKQVWDSVITSSGSEPELMLKLVSEAGDEGYPGKLQVEVRYTLTADNELKIAYRAQTDAATVVNLTNHTYFNFHPFWTQTDGVSKAMDASSFAANSILDHRVRILASRYLPVDETLIPIGEPDAVAGTCMDFTELIPIADRLDVNDLQIQRATGGYDHTWVLGKPGATFDQASEAFDPVSEAFNQMEAFDKIPEERQAKQLSLAAVVEEPLSGRKMSVFTTQPALQFYTGNFLDGSLRGKQDLVYGKHSGFCLETQHYPDSPNHSDFPSTVLRPGEEYVEETVYRFE